MEVANKKYYSSIDGIRFVSAIFVILLHTLMIKLFYVKEYPDQQIAIERSIYYGLFLVAELAVTLFFVSSGFLIFMLLINEKKLVGKVNLKYFYIRRMLRIWPVYFVLIFISFGLLYNLKFFTIELLDKRIYSDYWISFGLMVLIQPHLQFIIFKPLPYIMHSWSIGVEEMFYLCVPFIVNFKRDIGRVLLVLLIVYILLITCINPYPVKGNPLRGDSVTIYSNPYINFFALFLHYFRLSAMLIGGLFAYLSIYYFEISSKFLMNKYVQVITWFCLLVLLILSIEFSTYTNEVYALLFGMITFMLHVEHKSLIRFNRFKLPYLGKRCYSLYLFHFIAISIVYKLGFYIFSNYHSLISNLYLYLVSILLSILFSILSYKYIESPFLRLKPNVRVQ